MAEDARIALVRARVADAASRYLTSEEISEQEFARRVMARKGVELRSLPSENNPISRKAIANLIGGKRVKSPTLNSIKTYLRIERDLPAHVFELRDELIRTGQQEYALTRASRFTPKLLQMFRGRYCIMSNAPRDFVFTFEIDFLPTPKMLVVRGVCLLRTIDTGEHHKIVLAGYVIPAKGYSRLHMWDFDPPVRYDMEIRTRDLLSAGRTALADDNEVIMDQTAEPARTMFPAEYETRASPLLAAPPPGSKPPFPLRNRDGTPFLGQATRVLRLHDEHDIFNIESAEYKARKFRELSGHRP